MKSIPCLCIVSAGKNMVYYIIMIKLRLLCTFTILDADNSPKTTILRQRWWHRAKEILLFRFPSKRNSIILEGHFFLFFGYESKCDTVWILSRKLNIKLFAAVVYFCLVDCYSCMKCKNVRDWKDQEDENSKHISLNFLSSKLEQMTEVFNLSWNGSGRIQFSCKHNCLHARGKMTKVKNGKKDRNKNRHSPDVQSLRQFRNLYQMPGLE